VSGRPGTAARDERRHLAPRKPGDPRSAQQQDRDRLLYTPALRRLAGVTQVASPTERQILHNRLTHTLEVAQIGRGIAELLLADPDRRTHAQILGGLDPDAVEAAALIHDLGHPPFGHTAEKELDRLACKRGVPDGFNGNAQSFRIVTRLAMRWPAQAGLNLTRATLDGALKYPWFRDPLPGPRHDKWGVYRTEEDEFRWVRQAAAGTFGDGRSLEAELMDWADDIAYAVHDLEDFYCARLIPLDRLTSGDLREQRRFMAGAWGRLQGRTSMTCDDLEQLTIDLFNWLPTMDVYRGLRQQRADLRTMTSYLVERYMRAISLAPGSSPRPRAVIDPVSRNEVDILKQLTWEYVISTPALATQQHGQRRVIRDLFRIYERATRTPEEHAVLPDSSREVLEEVMDVRDEQRRHQERIRLVVDLIASMTEQQALDMHRRLTGLNLGSVLDPSGI
jgi:dGTPase